MFDHILINWVDRWRMNTPWNYIRKIHKMMMTINDPNYLHFYLRNAVNIWLVSGAIILNSHWFVDGED